MVIQLMPEKKFNTLQKDFPTPTIKITNQKSELVRIILSRDVHFTFFFFLAEKVINQ